MRALSDLLVVFTGTIWTATVGQRHYVACSFTIEKPDLGKKSMCRGDQGVPRLSVFLFSTSAKPQSTRSSTVRKVLAQKSPRLWKFLGSAQALSGMLFPLILIDPRAPRLSSIISYFEEPPLGQAMGTSSCLGSI